MNFIDFKQIAFSIPHIKFPKSHTVSTFCHKQPAFNPKGTHWSDIFENTKIHKKNLQR